MDQGPLTHTNGGYPQGGPYFGPLVYGVQNGGSPGGYPQGGSWTPPGRALSRPGGPNYPPRVTVGI